MITNYLKPLLRLFISLEKTRYVEWLQILDGIIMDHKTIHSLEL